MAAGWQAARSCSGTECDSCPGPRPGRTRTRIRTWRCARRRRNGRGSRAPLAHPDREHMKAGPRGDSGPNRRGQPSCSLPAVLGERQPVTRNALGRAPVAVPMSGCAFDAGPAMDGRCRRPIVAPSPCRVCTWPAVLIALPLRRATTGASMRLGAGLPCPRSDPLGTTGGARARSTIAIGAAAAGLCGLADGPFRPGRPIAAGKAVSCL